MRLRALLRLMLLLMLPPQISCVVRSVSVFACVCVLRVRVCVSRLLGVCDLQRDWVVTLRTLSHIAAFVGLVRGHLLLESMHLAVAYPQQSGDAQR